MRKYLESNDYEVLTAESPDEAFHLLTGAAPSVIFLDHIMPGVEGFSVLQKLKATPGTGDLPVVVCSSNEGASFVEQAIAHGAAAVLQKPPSPEQMAQVLRTLPVVAEPAASAKATPAATPAPTKAGPPAAKPAPAARAASAAAPPRFGERLSQGVAGLREQLEQQILQATAGLSAEIAELRAQLDAWRNTPAAPAHDPAAVAAAVQDGLNQAESAWLPPLRRELSTLQGRLDALESKLERQLAAVQQSLRTELQNAQEARSTELAALEQRLREAAAAAARAGVEAAVEDAATRLSEQVTDSILAALGQPPQAG